MAHFDEVSLLSNAQQGSMLIWHDPMHFLGVQAPPVRQRIHWPVGRPSAADAGA